MTVLAVFAVALALGTWLGVRLAEEGRRIDSVVATILATPLPDPSASAAHDLGAADTGARVGESPRPGAGSTSIPPAPVALTGQSARPAPGLHN